MIAMAFYIREFQMLQLYFLTFFPVWWVVVRFLNNPSYKIKAAKHFPLIGAIVLAVTLLVPYWHGGEAIQIFNKKTVPSLLLLFSICFAGYGAVYYAFNKKENWWNRFFLTVVCALLWYWVNQEIFSHRMEAVGWLLLVIALVPLFWKITVLYPIKLYRYANKNGRKLSPAILTGLVLNKDVTKDIKDKALPQITSGKALYQLYLNEKIEAQLSKKILKQIRDEAILLSIIADGKDDIDCRKIAVEQVHDEAKLATVINEVESEDLRLEIASKIENQTTLVSAIQDTSIGQKTRELIATKITSDLVLFDLFQKEKKQAPAFCLYLLKFIRSPHLRRSILLDADESDEFRLALLAKEKDYVLFKQTISGFGNDDMKLRSIDEIEEPKILDAVLSDNSMNNSLRIQAARELLTENEDLLSPDFLRYQLVHLLPDYLENNNTARVVRVLRNTVGFFGQFGQLGLVQSLFPFQKVRAWYERFLQNEETESEMEESDLYVAGKEENTQVHWAVANCYAILPDQAATSLLRNAFIKARDGLRKTKGKEFSNRKALFYPEMIVGALLKALGHCASEMVTYTDFAGDRQVLEEIIPLDESITAMGNELNNYYKDRYDLLQRLMHIEHLTDEQIKNHPDYIAIQEKISPLELAINELVEARHGMEHRLSAAHFLMRVATNAQDYISYVRQHAYAGLSPLLHDSCLEKEAKDKIRDTMDALQKDPNVEEKEMELAEEGEVDLDAEKADRSDREYDPSFSIYELRLMPNSKKGEVNYIFFSALSLIANRDEVPNMPHLYGEIEELCLQMGGVIRFFEQFPLKIMPRPMRSRLAYFREIGYKLTHWTKYRPPKNVSGNVIYRYSEVEDYTQPNSMGIVFNMFSHKLLLIPVLFHEYQHYQDIKNEGDVWLREQYFLRHLIAKYAPQEQEQFNGYLKQVFALFSNIRDMLTLALLRTDFQQTDQLRAFNAFIVSHYGRQMKEPEAKEKANRQIQLENLHLYNINRSLTWDPIKQFPALDTPETVWQTRLIRDIVKTRKMQRNTITAAEVKSILNDPEINRYAQEWEEFTSQIHGVENLLHRLPSLVELMSWRRMGMNDDDLLVFKS